MLRFKDVNNNPFAAEGTSTFEERLSSDVTITLDIPYTEVNKDFIYDISANWKVSGIKGPEDNTEYIIKYVNRKSRGSKPYVEVTAMSLFIEKLNTTYLYNLYEGDYTLTNVLTTVFNASGFAFAIKESYDINITMDTYGDGQSKLEIFKYAMDLWEMEFVINGDVVEIYKKLIRRPDYVLHDRLNAGNVSLEEDAASFYTYVRGYGDINDGEPLSTAGVAITYEHPLSAVVGRKEAPPIRLINTESTSPYASVIRDELNKQAKKLVDDSLKFSITADFLTLKEYPEASPKLGDEILFAATNIDYNAVVRLVAISTRRNHLGVIIAQSVTFGDQPLVYRRNAVVNSATRFITEVTTGVKQIPSNMVDKTDLIDESMIDEKVGDKVTRMYGDAVADLENENSIYIEQKKRELQASYDAAVKAAEDRVKAIEPDYTAFINKNINDIAKKTMDNINSGYQGKISSNAINVEYGFVKNLAADQMFANDIKSLSMSAFEGNITKLRSEIITAGSITAEALKADNAMITKLTAGDLMADKIAASSAIVNKIQSTSITTNQLTMKSVATELGKIPAALTIQRPDGYNVIINGETQFGLAVWRYSPQFTSATATVDVVGSYYRITSSTSGASAFNAFAFKHDSRYLVVNLQAYTGSGYTGWVEASGFNGTDIYQRYSVSSTSPQTLKYTIDLGRPTGDLKYFYLRADTGTNLHIFVREIVIYQED